jgi:casein kinase II subunit beta
MLPITSDWKQVWCRRPENRWYCEVPNTWLKQPAKWIGLEILCRQLDQVVDAIMGRPVKDVLPTFNEWLPAMFGILHARYLSCIEGQRALEKRWREAEFGKCQRIGCEEVALLPYGPSGRTGVARVRALCPCCLRLYAPTFPAGDLDGAFFPGNAALMVISDLRQRGKTFPEFVPYKWRAFGLDIRVEAGLACARNGGH